MYVDVNTAPRQLHYGGFFSVYRNMLPCCCLSFGPHGSGIANVLAKLLEIKDVQILGGVDQIDESLRELGVLVKVLELQGDPCHFVTLLRVFGLRGVVVVLFLVDCHHLDQMPDRVLPINGGSATSLKAPLAGTTIYHWNRQK